MYKEMSAKNFIKEMSENNAQGNIHSHTSPTWPQLQIYNLQNYHHSTIHMSENSTIHMSENDFQGIIHLQFVELQV